MRHARWVLAIGGLVAVAAMIGVLAINVSLVGPPRVPSRPEYAGAPGAQVTASPVHPVANGAVNDDLPVGIDSDRTEGTPQPVIRLLCTGIDRASLASLSVSCVLYGNGPARGTEVRFGGQDATLLDDVAILTVPLALGVARIAVWATCKEMVGFEGSFDVDQVLGLVVRPNDMAMGATLGDQLLEGRPTSAIDADQINGRDINLNFVRCCTLVIRTETFDGEFLPVPSVSVLWHDRSRPRDARVRHPANPWRWELVREPFKLQAPPDTDLKVSVSASFVDSTRTMRLAPGATEQVVFRSQRVRFAHVLLLDDDGQLVADAQVGRQTDGRHSFIVGNYSDATRTWRVVVDGDPIGDYYACSPLHGETTFSLECRPRGDPQRVMLLSSSRRVVVRVQLPDGYDPTGIEVEITKSRSYPLGDGKSTVRNLLSVCSPLPSECELSIGVDAATGAIVQPRSRDFVFEPSHISIHGVDAPDYMTVVAFAKPRIDVYVYNGNELFDGVATLIIGTTQRQRDRMVTDDSPTAVTIDRQTKWPLVVSPLPESIEFIVVTDDLRFGTAVLPEPQYGSHGSVEIRIDGDLGFAEYTVFSHVRCAPDELLLVGSYHPPTFQVMGTHMHLFRTMRAMLSLQDYARVNTPSEVVERMAARGCVLLSPIGETVTLPAGYPHWHAIAPDVGLCRVEIDNSRRIIDVYPLADTVAIEGRIEPPIDEPQLYVVSLRTVTDPEQPTAVGNAEWTFPISARGDFSFRLPPGEYDLRIARGWSGGRALRLRVEQQSAPIVITLEGPADD